MKLPVISAKHSLHNKRILLRVDWNVPLDGSLEGEHLQKIEQSLHTVREYASRGARLVLVTHLGRPQGVDRHYSTRDLARTAGKMSGLKIEWRKESLVDAKELTKLQKDIDAAPAGSVFLLENIRFYPGEEKNDLKLAKSLASLADVYVNDAFAACHRSHASIVGAAKLLPHFAGPNLCAEIQSLQKIYTSPKQPFVVVLGGAKLETKLPLIQGLVKQASAVYLGGAMVIPCLAAKGYRVGATQVSPNELRLAKSIIKHKQIHLPEDAVVAGKIAAGVHPHVVSVDRVGAKEKIGDIGPATVRVWAEAMRKAKTILWNGSLGVAEIPAFSHGSLMVARHLASRSRGKTYGVVGGGDTVPLAFATGMSEWFDHISMGGGAMLEAIVLKGKLPGIVALLAASKKR